MDEDLAKARFEQALAGYEQDFETFFLARLLGLRFAYEDDTCTVSFEVPDFAFNPQGSLHGGIIATVMDISMGHLIKHRIGKAAVTVEMKTQYMRPLTAGTARCVGRPLRMGRTVSYMESRLFDADDHLAAVATATWLMPKS